MDGGGPISAQIICLTALVLVFGYQSVIIAQPTPAQVTQIVDTLMPSDKTLSARLRSVDTVIRCRVESSQALTIPMPYVDVLPPGADPLTEAPEVVTEHSVTVLEVFKRDVRLSVGSRMPVLQQAGTAMWNGYSITVEGPFKTLLQVGAEYVLFLNGNTSLFWVSPYYAYRNSGGVVAGAN